MKKVMIMIKAFAMTFLCAVTLVFSSSCDWVSSLVNEVINEIEERDMPVIDPRTLGFASSRQRADERVEQVVSIINDKDRSAFRTVFSEKALEEAADFEGGLDFLFELIQGEILSWERDVIASDQSSRDGKRSLMIRYACTVTTEHDDYVLFFIDYIIDTINPDNEGLYMLQARSSGFTSNLGPWQNRMKAGFFIPEFEWR